MTDLLGSGSESDSEDHKDVFKTDNNYAAKYDQWRGKEHLQKLKDKYGEDYEEGGSESEEDDEDDDAEELTKEIEEDFFATLASLKKKDPKLYDGKTEFFKVSKSSKANRLSKEDKVTIGDVERQVMLEKGGKFDELEDNKLKAGDSLTYNEEMQRIKDSFKNAIKEEEADDDILTKRSKTEKESREEAESYKAWLAGQKSDIEDSVIEDKMKGLRDFWNKDDLDEGEKFLKDYLLNKRYKENENNDYVPSYDEIVHDSDDDLSEDEKNVAKQEEFEHKFNFRFEEPDEEFIKRYPRTIKDSLRKDGDKRIKKRKEVEERKKREKEQKKEDLKMLQSMKKKEIMKKLETLKKITGNADMELNEEDIEGDFDPQEYDKKMQEIFGNYDDNVVVEDEEKPTFSDIDDEYDYEYEDDMEDWDNWTGSKNEDDEEEELNCEDEGFNMDCEYQQEVIDSTKGRKKGRRKSKFAEALEENTSKPVFDPKDKTFTEYVDEYYKLDCEDMIGDLPCRFKYRTVQQNDFGLSVEEVLAAPDKELNAWVSLRKTCQYRSQEEERKDFHVFRNKGKDINFKKKVMPTIFDETEKETRTEEKESTAGKKRKRKKKKKQQGVNKEEEPAVKKVKVTENQEVIKAGEDGEDKKKRRKKKKKTAQTTSGAIQIGKVSGFFDTGSKKTSKVQQSESNSDLLQFSNERLKAYGVNPGQFKRKLKKEKFKNVSNNK